MKKGRLFVSDGDVPSNSLKLPRLNEDGRERDKARGKEGMSKRTRELDFSLLSVSEI